MHIILLAGGKGTRLWPLSRKGLPKHLISLKGEGSLFQETVKRALPLLGPDEKIVVVSNRDQERLLRAQLESLGVAENRVIYLWEPIGRNTAPAVCWAVVSLMRGYGSGTAAMFPCDHRIEDEEVFVSQVGKAGSFVGEKGGIVLFGIVPHYPATGYGYIQVDKERPSHWDGEEFYPVLGFKEKPNLETARSYLEAGSFFWNSGMLVFSLADFYELAKEFMPEIISPLESKSPVEVYPGLPSISVDYALLEKVSGLHCLPARFRWSDLGSWSAVYELEEKDGDGNVFLAEVLAKDVRDSLIISQSGKTVGIIGADGMVVVDTPDSLLICPMDRVQEVKEIVERLDEEGKVSWRDPAKVERPWGYYVVLDRGPRFKTKRIVVYPGRSLSLQRHQHRSEHWVVLKGVAKVRRGEEEFLVHPNESTFIPPGVVHKLSNPGKIDLEIIEVQNGDYIEEDDIERLDE